MPPRANNLMALHYFGSSAEESIKNRAISEYPATQVGDVSYGENFAEITDTSGFNLALPINIRSYTAIVVCTDSYIFSDPSTMESTLHYISSLNSTIYIRRHIGNHDAFATTGIATAIISDNNTDLDRNKYRFKAISCDGTTVTTATQFQTGLLIKTAPLGSIAGVYDEPTFLKLGQKDVSANATAAKMTMAAIYNIGLNAEDLTIAFSGYFKQELAARGMAI